MCFQTWWSSKILPKMNKGKPLSQVSVVDSFQFSIIYCSSGIIRSEPSDIDESTSRGTLYLHSKLDFLITLIQQIKKRKGEGITYFQCFYSIMEVDGSHRPVFAENLKSSVPFSLESDQGANTKVMVVQGRERVLNSPFCSWVLLKL